MTPRIEAEVSQWPGAAIVRVEQGGKHRRLFLRYGNRERFVVFPTSASDVRAELNQVRDVRKVLAELGAARNERRKAKVRRLSNRPARNPLASIPFAPVKADPWEALRQVQFAAQGTPTRSAKTILIGLVRRMVARWRKPCAQTPSGDHP